jgi:beta-lactamase regulating signal transducer with metallopeptidase domain
MGDIDNIYITNSDIQLGDIPDITEVISFVTCDEYLTYIYIAISIVCLVVVFLIYKYFTNREKTVTFQDKLDNCYGDICYS